ncbi:hypothetical protein Tco_1284249 [Tanacetum coccineum]
MIRVYKETKKELGVVAANEAEQKAKYDGVVVDLDENPVVIGLREELKSIEGQLKEHKEDYGRLLLEEKKWAGQKERVAALESKCDGAEVVSKMQRIGGDGCDEVASGPVEGQPPTPTKKSSPANPRSSAPTTATEKLVSPTLTPEKHATAALSSDPPV